MGSVLEYSDSSIAPMVCKIQSEIHIRLDVISLFVDYIGKWIHG